MALGELSIFGQRSGRALRITQSGDLYISCGYQIYRSIDWGCSWQLNAVASCAAWRRVLARYPLAARLSRNSFMALLVIPDGSRVAVARDGLYRASPGETTMERVFRLTRGSRPLNLCLDDRGRILFGEYGSFSQSETGCRIFVSDDGGKSFSVAWSLEPDEVNHIHNVIYDSYLDGFWVLAGDVDQRPGIGVLSKDLSRLDWVVRGSQMARAVNAFIEPDHILYGTDTEVAQNFICRMDKRTGHIEPLLPIEGSSLYASTFGDVKLIATCVEPSRVNLSRDSILYASADGDHWNPVFSCTKDHWPTGFFAFGTLVLPASDYPERRGMVSGQALVGIDGRVILASLGSAAGK